MKLRIGVLTVLGVAAVTAGSIGMMSGLVLKADRLRYDSPSDTAGSIRPLFPVRR